MNLALYYSTKIKYGLPSIKRDYLNFLAHQYLSGSNADIKIGNFIADLIRGKEKENFDKGIKEGIKLHREIDNFTDHHFLVKEAIELFKPTQGKYAPVIVDISFDHFLASNWENYHQQTLSDFAADFYQLMLDNFDLMPEKVQWIIPRMKTQNWFYEYQFLDGIQQAYEGISRRATFESNMAYAREGLEKNYEKLESIFKEFFEDIIQFVRLQNIEL